MVARRYGVGFVALTLLAMSTLVYAVASSEAASTRVTTAVKISPHVLTSGESGFITVTVTNRGPSTVNHVVATVGQAVYGTDGNMTGIAAMPLAASAFTSLPTGCTAVAAGPTSSTVVCDIGQLKPGTDRRMLSFIAPSDVQGFNVGVSTTFDESKGTQQTDTVVNFDPYPFSTVATTNAAVKGVCTADANELSASNGNQSTAADPPALGSGFPCTPLTVGVDSQKHPNNIPQTGTFGDISFVDFLGDAGLATVQVSFISGVPSGVNKNNAEIFELAKFPIDLTATDDGAPVPDCVKIAGNLQIPASSNFISCVVRVDNLSGGGLMFTLLAEGGDDGGWGGIG